MRIDTNRTFGERECPSCSTQVPANNNRCPICGYEFPAAHPALQKVYWTAGIILLIALLAMWL